MNTYSSKYNTFEINKLKSYFKAENCTFSTPQYMYFQARKEGLTASFYESGKFVIQGSKTEEILSKYFGGIPKKQENEQIPYPHIGVDESGKGDFFGPLVVAGVYLTEDAAKFCKDLGATDSKKMTDKKILEIAPKIKEVSIFDIIAISPSKYNELYSSFKNLNRLLAWGHCGVIENILKKQQCETALCDQFADEKVILNALKSKGKEIKVFQKTKAEEDTVVACASILARAEFVNRLEKLCARYEINLPKGASSEVIKSAKAFALKYSKEELKNVAKTHFKTYSEI